MRLRSVLTVAAMAALPAIANAQWSDSFDTYLPGTINGQTTGGPNALGTWQGWDNLASAAGTVVTAPTVSAPHSQQITVGDDSVQRYQGVTAGGWSYSTQVFVPQGNLGESYFLLLNQYANLGPYNWSVQIEIDSTAGIVVENQTTGTNVSSPGGAPLPLVFGSWVPLRVDFDLTANTAAAFYNGLPLWAGTWNRSAGSTMTLGCVDLYHATGTGSVFYDNMSLVPAPASLALLAMGGLVAGRRRRA